VIVINSATHSQKDGVEGNGGSSKDGAATRLLHGVQLVLRSSVLTVLNPNEVNVTLVSAVSIGQCCLANPFSHCSPSICGSEVCTCLLGWSNMNASDLLDFRCCCKLRSEGRTHVGIITIYVSA